MADDIWHACGQVPVINRLEDEPYIANGALNRKDDLLNAAFAISPDGKPSWTPPQSLRVDSSEGILRKIVFPLSLIHI